MFFKFDDCKQIIGSDLVEKFVSTLSFKENVERPEQVAAALNAAVQAWVDRAMGKPICSTGLRSEEDKAHVVIKSSSNIGRYIFIRRDEDYTNRVTGVVSGLEVVRYNKPSSGYTGLPACEVLAKIAITPIAALKPYRWDDLRYRSNTWAIPVQQ